MNRNDGTDKRVPWVDVLKFLGIFAIYLGHFGEEAGKLYPFVYTYHVPLFFFVSGFFADVKREETLFSFVVKKFRTLMVPYFAFVALSVLIHLLQYNLYADQMLFELRRYIFAIRNTLLHPSLWFFSCLFIVSVLHRLILTVTKTKWMILAISLVLACFCRFEQPMWFWNADSALLYLVYYTLGNICFSSVNKYRYAAFRIKGKLMYIILTAISFLMVYKTYFYGTLYLTLTAGLRLPLQAQALLTILNTMIIIFANIQLAFFLEKMNVVQSIGKETLILCGMEFVTKNVLYSIFTMLSLPVKLDTPFITFLYAVLCICVSYKVFVPILHKHFGRLLGIGEDMSNGAFGAGVKQIERPNDIAV